MAGFMRRISLGAGLSVLILGLAPAASLSGQSLEQVDLLTRDGRMADARDELTAWWESSWDDASREDRQKGLWFRAALTLDPTQAAAQFRRLVVEFPGGNWTAPALLRLGQMALIDDDIVGAARQFEVLVRDYPASGARLEASEWLSDNELMLEQARAVAAREAAQTPPIAPAQPARTDSVAPAEAASRGDWAVQLGAFSSATRALELAVRAREAGFEPRLVRVGDSELIRVRIGFFHSDSEAATVYDRLLDGGFEARIVQDAAREVAGG